MKALRKFVSFPVCLGAVLLIGFLGHPSARSAAQDAPSTKDVPKGQGFGDIPGALRSSPGCLGVEVAKTSGGKLVIFAWFKNKRATQDWYFGQAHRGMMKMMGATPAGTPLSGVKDEKSPVMVIASITPSEKTDATTHLPVSQIAVEMYAPLPGGFAFNGRFAPDNVKVSGLASAKASEPAKK